MMRKYIEIVAFLVVFMLGVYLLFMPTLQYVYELRHASYQQDMVGQFDDIEQLEIVHYTNNTIASSSLIFLSSIYYEGVFAVDRYGQKQFLIKNFPDYKVDFNNINFDSKGQLWVLPGSYSSKLHSYSVPWIYVLNISTGEIVEKIATNNSSRGHALCMHNDRAYIAFDNSGFRASFGFVENYVLNTTVELDYDIGMVEGHLCLNDSMVILHHDAIVRYYYNNTQDIEFLVKENNNTMYSITWGEKNIIYYIEDIKKNSSRVSNIISFDLISNQTNNVINMPFNVHDIMYDDGLLYVAGDDHSLYIYNITANKYYEKLNYIGRYPSIHKLNNNVIMIGSYLLNKEDNMLYYTNISECCWDATMIGS